MGYVYFLRETVTNTVKIGKSKRIGDRIGSLTASLPFEVKEEFIIPTNFEDDLEKLMHRIFEHKRIRAEWFGLSESDLDILKSGNYEMILEPLNIEDKELTKKLLDLYIQKVSINKRKQLSRVNVCLDYDVHSKLREVAYQQEMTKTGFGAEIIKTVLTDEKLLDQVIHKMCS